ncbi:MAG: TIGR03936 family radical SAM-associated protein [Oscillospiraceae bacterium]|nr:TIGR03936 family radical SAM-associated protein [Oscillospiraceae bacterium]
MSKLRLLFKKEAQASYISHLDLIRTFQRAFPRVGLEIKHTQGFHPHPIMSIVLPLSVGQSSCCELMEFEVTQLCDGSGVAEKLNEGMPMGLEVLDCYEVTRPVREMAYLDATLELEYDNGVPAGAVDALKELFGREELVIQKKTKHKTMADVDIRPMIHSMEMEEREGLVVMRVVVQAQNPGLNPSLLVKAIETHLADFAPDFARVHRNEVMDAEMKKFR